MRQCVSRFSPSESPLQSGTSTTDRNYSAYSLEMPVSPLASESLVGRDYFCPVYHCILNTKYSTWQLQIFNKDLLLLVDQLKPTSKLKLMP